MTPELQNALTTFVNQLITLVQSGTAQLPAILQDIVAYQLFDAWFAVFVGVILGGISVLCFITAAAADDYGEWNTIGKILGTLAFVAGLVLALVGAYHVYYVTHFPRLVILDYLKGLL